MLKKLVILLALVALAASMGRPRRHRHQHKDCSCEIPSYNKPPCDDSAEPTPPDDQETTAAPTSTSTLKPTTPTTTKVTTVPTTTKTSTVPTTTRTSTVSTTTKTTIVPTTTKTTTVAPTTTYDDPGCPARDMVPFKRKNGWWCELGTAYDTSVGGAAMGKTYATTNCNINNMTLSSLETEEEWSYWRQYILNIGYVTGAWVAITKNGTAGEYYWNDGQAIPLIDPQPKVVYSTGQAAWIFENNATAPPYGYLAVVPANGVSTSTTPNINMGVCGVAGRQFT